MARDLFEAVRQGHMTPAEAAREMGLRRRWTWGTWLTAGSLWAIAALVQLSSCYDPPKAPACNPGAEWPDPCAPRLVRDAGKD